MYIIACQEFYQMTKLTEVASSSCHFTNVPVFDQLIWRNTSGDLRLQSQDSRSVILMDVIYCTDFLVL